MKETRMKNAIGRNFFLLALIGAVIPLAAVGAVGPNGAGENGVDFSIRFFDRRVYHVSSDPIKIQVTITNNSPRPYRFKLADERVFSLDFDVRTLSNRPLEPADALVRKRTQLQQVFFREIAVETGESFSFVEDLRDYVRLNEHGSFVVQARLHPELIRLSDNRPVANNAGLATFPASLPAGPELLESKRLSLSVRPPVVQGPDGVPLEMDIATGAVLARERMAPDQVVDYTITARQRSQWERFFLYLDLESMLSRDAVRQRRWNAESEEGRRRMIEVYRQELRNPTADGSISVIPNDYEIERTQYGAFDGTVTVLKKFRSTTFTELKRYTYYLQMKDNVWAIVDYSVVNLGTE
jgi:hypothetical protein